MTLLDYCKQIPSWGDFIHIEESQVRVDIKSIIDLWEKQDGNAHAQFDYFNVIMSNFLPEDYYRELIRYTSDYTGSVCLSTEAIKSLNEISIVIDKEVSEYYATARKPYYRSRGKSITPEQAAQIKDQLGVWHFCYIASQDGNICTNSITSIKLPNGYEILSDAVKMEVAIPDMDCMIALTDWNEIPDYAWEIWPEGKWEESNYNGGYPGFLEHIEFGLWLHDRTIEFMEPVRARAKYQEYEALYK